MIGVMDKMSMTIKQKQYLRWVFLGVAALIMLTLQVFEAPTLSDDIMYHFVWQEDEAAPARLVQNASDLLTSQWAHYQMINGRWAAHLLAQAFLSFTPPIVYQTISALLFALMLYLGSCLMVAREHRLFAMVVMFFLLFVVFADIKTTVFWSMGTFNYPVVIVANLLLLLYMRRVRHSASPVHYFLSPLAVLAGCGHEGLTLPLSLTLLVYVFADLRKDSLFPRALYIFWYVVGMLTCLLSPGIWQRADGDITLMSRMISGAINIVMNLKVTWLLVITLVVGYFKQRASTIQAVLQRRYFYLCLLLVLGIVVVCGTNLERVVFYADFIAMLLLVELWALLLSERWQQRVKLLCCVVIMVYLVPATLVRYDNYKSYRLMEQQMAEPGREVVAVRCPVVGEQPVMDFFRRRFVNPSAEFGFYCCYMGFNAHDINIRYAAAQYGKQQLVFLPDDVVARIQRDSTAYSNYELDRNGSLYIWQLPVDQPVDKVVFHLKPEDLSALNPLKRLIAYKEDTYEYDDHFHYSVVHVEGRPYLVFTRPTTNIYRRIGTIAYQ